ncbi:hypothetical protein CU097_005000 [Rhizopus azygosporus]|uniref:Uncharacterized protein n=1 Tax=Rhizopus azygosporus TaxID=86630 RepID=A0A367JL26_RHIAZ|nr:hypothetical protein CU097_005000 [Rhizopus azygosporus]
MMTAVDDHQTKRRVEARFKSDLDGMLEYFEKNPSVREAITTELLQEHFDTTFDRTKSFTVSAAFAKVLLNALINRKGKSITDIHVHTIDQAYAEYQNDFSVPRFADGLRTNEFLKLMDMYDLYGAVIHHLYTLDTRSALLALQNIFKENASDVKSFKPNLYTTYIKLLFTLHVDDEDFYQQSEDAFMEEIRQSSKDPMGLFVIANLLQQMLIQASLQNRNKKVGDGMSKRISRMLSFMGKIHQVCPGGLPQAIIAAIPATFRSQLGTFLSESSPTSKKRKLSHTIYLQNRNCQNTRAYESSLKETWESVKHKETGLSKHETAFVLLCNYLERKIIPTFNKSSSRSLQSKGKYLTALEELQTTIRNNDTAKESLMRVKLWCIDVLINNDRFWISVLKIMIQFIDIWSRDIVKAGAETVIGSFIAKEKLLEHFSKHLSGLVKFYEQSGDKSSLYIIKDACLIYERSIDCIESPEYLNSIRQLLFNERLPCFGLAEIWNIRFSEELTLIINQITITEDDDECFTTQSTSKKLVLHDNDRYGNQPSCSSYDLIRSLESAADNWGQLLWLDHFPAIAKSKTFRNISKDGQENGLKDKFSKEGWEYLFKMCLLSTRMTDSMFMVTSTWKENLECLWVHPYECKIIKEGFQHALHPQNGFSLCPLFPKLIVYFLGALFETLPSEDVIRRYDYANTGSKYLVHRLTRAGLKQYFSILYTIELIKDQLRKDYDVADEMDCYYISSLIKTIRELADWSKLCHVQGTPGYQQLRKLLTQNTSDIECLNYASYTNDNDAQGEESISNRSLALLTITHLCTLSVEARRNELISALLSMLVMQITEGLIDSRQQQHFNTMLSNQTKDRANRWRKLKRQKKVMIYRPILSNEEELAVIDFVRQLPNADQVLQALGLNGPKPLDNMKQLYFL